MLSPPSPETLRRLYWDEKLSAREIAIKSHISETKVLKLMRKYDVPRRTTLDALRLSTRKQRGKRHLKFLPETLREMYWIQNKSITEMETELGICSKYIARLMKKYDIPKRGRSEAITLALSKITLPRGAETPQWKGGRLERSGYIHIKAEGHPRADKNGYVAEHILVWEKANNRPLPKGWIVHHFNGIKNDNRPENLLAMPHKDHRKLLSSFQNKLKDLQAITRQLYETIEIYQRRNQIFIEKEETK